MIKWFFRTLFNLLDWTTRKIDKLMGVIVRLMTRIEGLFLLAVVIGVIL